MEWINEMIKQFESVSEKIEKIDTPIVETVSKNKEVLLNLNKDQLLSGRNVKNQTLTPGYLQDPYFITSEQAQWYADMKERLEFDHRLRVTYPLIYPLKGKNTPNLIVTGTFQDSMLITTTSKSFEITATYEETADIERKYGGVLGLAEPSIEFFWTEFLKGELVKYIFG